MARVKQPTVLGMGKWGYVDTGGHLTLPFNYLEASDFNENIAVVKIGGSKCYIDNMGNVLIDTACDQADVFHEGLAAVSVKFRGFDKRNGFMYPDGEILYLDYQRLYGFSEGLAVAYDGDNWLYLDKTLKPALFTEYDNVASFHDGLAMVEKDGKRGYIDKTGREVISPCYENARSFSEGLAAVAVTTEMGLRWGYIDKNGAMVISPEYEAAGDFSQGFAVVKDTYYGYIDAGGVMGIPPVYLNARSFSEGLAWVETVNGWGILEIRDCFVEPVSLNAEISDDADEQSMYTLSE